MASVTSLDHDMRNLRMSRYTASAANEARAWIEESLGEKIATGDLITALKDGVVLCRLANRIIPSPGIKYKQSNMPFVQMENISHFLRACEAPPFNMPAHDRFLTVDLYESKDPAQVLQCLGAFSRVANTIDPATHPTTIGPRKATPMSPSSTGAGGTRSSNTSPYVTSASFSRPSSAMRPLSPTKTGESTASSNAGGVSRSTRSPVSTWSKKGDEGNTSPAWNILQYGYMGGASQNNQGISFGGRRQITSAGTNLPNAMENERKRKEQAAEEERLRVAAEEAEHRRKTELEAEEERERVEEEQRWEVETKRLREEERDRLAEQKRQWEEQERKWKAEDEARKTEQADIDKRLSKHLTGGQSSGQATNDARLNGQYLSQYQAEQKENQTAMDTPESRRVRDLEKQLEAARERERQYQAERNRAQKDNRSDEYLEKNDTGQAPPSPKDSEVSWTRDYREVTHQAAPVRQTAIISSVRPLPVPLGPPKSCESTVSVEEDAAPSLSAADTVHAGLPQPQNKLDRYLAQNPAPMFDVRPTTHQPDEMGFSSTIEEQTERDRRIASQQQTKAGGWASKSILEREMERERERQKEWEAEQQTARPARPPGGGRIMGPRPPP